MRGVLIRSLAVAANIGLRQNSQKLVRGVTRFDFTKRQITSAYTVAHFGRFRIQSLDLHFTSAMSSISGDVPNEGSPTVPNTIEVGSSTVPRTMEEENSTVPRTMEVGNSTVPRTIEEGSSTVPRTMEEENSTVPRTIEEGSSTVPRTIEEGNSTVPRTMEEESSTVSRTMEEESSTVSRTMEEESSTVSRTMEEESSTVSRTMEEESSTVPRTMEEENSTVPRTMEEENSTIPRTMEEDEALSTSHDEEVRDKSDQESMVVTDELKTQTGETLPKDYIPHGKFTTEIHKIELRNVPKVGYAVFRKFLQNKGLDPVKIKMVSLPGGQNINYITFRNDEAREFAIKALDGVEWKNRTLKAKAASATPDPYYTQKRTKSSDKGKTTNKAKRAKYEGMSPEERLAEATTPLYKIPYSEQLKIKMEMARSVVQHITKSLEENEWLKEQMKKNDGLMCPLEDIAPSPVEYNYRNKCEFTIGSPGPGKEGKVIGFRVGSYRDGDISVVPPTSCLHVPDNVKEIVKVSQMFIDGSQYSAFSPIDHSGHWVQLAVRSYCSGDTMATFQFHPQSLTPDLIEGEKQRLKHFFSSGPGVELKLSSLYFHIQGRRLPGNQSSGEDHLLLGAEHVYEQLLGHKFRISREAFFQVSTQAAEVLYRILGEWCGAWPSATLFDICCGTGTIGLCLSKSVDRVVGIEMVPEAVDDAIVNAKLNGISTAEFHCGKAEDVLPELIKNETSKEVVGILDPPRGGIGTSVINAVRKCEGLKRLLYLSCDPENKGAISNFVALCRHRTKHTPGKPFRTVRALPVDLFPQTRHYELIILFER